MDKILCDPGCLGLTKGKNNSGTYYMCSYLTEFSRYKNQQGTVKPERKVTYLETDPETGMPVRSKNCKYRS